MRRTVLLLAFAVIGLGARAGEAAEAPRPALLIIPAPVAEWKADIQDVQHVLMSAANELWRYFPERTLPPIVVAPQGGPITWFRRGLHGEYYVQLNTGGTFWNQYAYQMAHEFCHILCNYRDDEKSNKWLEESLCELASIFAMRRMADTWAKTPPYPNWRSFAPTHRTYADDRLKKGELPPNTPFAEWFRENEGAMRKEPCLREKNNVVAAALLPLFEKQPEHWEAVTWLNAQPVREPRTLEQHLAAWRAHCPEKHRPFVAEIAKVFGIALPAE
ncbi:MAG TPA: hypothetical protein PLE19_05940 [Planctomycetota bacterium]|nr:hypothetical protein [Planctomycetota bacterium]HRR80263.1 hypothetical protein [Planctomycetota bacterium]HRT93371.1 hypothetical protein [Planctomycetota bacterium]